MNYNQQIMKEENVAYINSTILPFLRKNGDRRISKATLEYYSLFSIFSPDREEVVFSTVKDGETLIAISIVGIRNKSQVISSTTVVHKDYRRQGAGTAALKAKLQILKDKGMGIKTMVAEDNEPSMSLCKKVGLVKVEVVEKTRATGVYNAVIWTDPPQRPAG